MAQSHAMWNGLVCNILQQCDKGKNVGPAIWTNSVDQIGLHCEGGRQWVFANIIFKQILSHV